MADRIRTTLYADPACPWGYSEIPALRVLEWRYRSRLDWRLVTIGLTESADQYAKRGYTPLRMARGQASFRRYGMPFALEPKAHLAGTARGCRAVVAARLSAPGSEWKALRALQLCNFTTPLVLDDDERISAIVGATTGVGGQTILSLLDSPEVDEAYAGDREEARSAAETAAETQGKTAVTDAGLVRYTASSVLFELDGTRMLAGGFQPIEAYDVLVANLDPTIERHAAPDGPAELLELFPDGLTTQEIAAMLARGNDLPDRGAAELALFDLIAEGGVERIAVGDDALWAAPGYGDALRSIFSVALAGAPLEAVGS
jgi:protein-disulfide isomerase-like protein with CxxC motif